MRRPASQSWPRTRLHLRTRASTAPMRPRGARPFWRSASRSLPGGSGNPGAGRLLLRLPAIDEVAVLEDAGLSRDIATARQIECAVRDEKPAWLQHPLDQGRQIPGEGAVQLLVARADIRVDQRRRMLPMLI